MNTIIKFVVPGAAFLLTLLSGLGLSNAGKPYNGILFNVHKLIALGAVVATGVQVVKWLKIVDFPALVVVLLVVAALCVVALFASGALMSLDKLDYALILLIHRVAPAGLVLAMALVVYLLAARVPGQ
jgi:hypothetical protein